MNRTDRVTKRRYPVSPVSSPSIARRCFVSSAPAKSMKARTRAERRRSEWVSIHRPSVEFRQQITDAGQVGHSIAEETGQQRRAKTLTRQLEHAMGRIRLGDQSFRIEHWPRSTAAPDAGPKLSPNPMNATESIGSGAELRGQVAPAVDAPSPGANSPSDQRFRRVIGQANRDVGVAPRKVERSDWTGSIRPPRPDSEPGTGPRSPA